MHTSLASKKDGAFLVLEDQEVKHLKVKRLSVGSDLLVIWKGSIFLCKLRSLEKDKALCEILKEVETKDPPIKVSVYQAVPTDIRTMDLIVQKCTEIGVERVIPIITSRSFQDKKAIEKRRSRWEKIIREAMKQCRRPNEMIIENATKLQDIPLPKDTGIVLDNFSAETPIKEIKVKCGKEVSVVVGPEGGFSRKEVNLLKDKGYTPVILEGYTYRTETATIVAAGFIINSADS